VPTDANLRTTSRFYGDAPTLRVPALFSCEAGIERTNRSAYAFLHAEFGRDDPDVVKLREKSGAVLVRA